MISKTALAMTVATLAFGASSAIATTIDLTTLPLGAFTSATFGDYQIDNVPGYGSGSDVFTATSGLHALGDDIGEGNGSGYIITRVDGGAFNLDFVTFGQSLNNYGRVTLATYSNQENGVYVLTDGQTIAPGITNRTDIFIDSNSFSDNGGVGISSFDVSLFAGGAVPEPASWAMMILGLGAVGFAMRARKQSLRVTSA